MAGFDRRDPGSIRSAPPDFLAATERPIDGLRIAWSPDFGFAEVDPDVARITKHAALAFQDLGCTVEEIDITLLEPYDSFGPIQAATAYNNIAKHLPRYGDQMTAYGQYWMERGSQVTTADYAAALGRIDELKATFDDVFATYDLVLAPVARFPRLHQRTIPRIRHRNILLPPSSSGTAHSPCTPTPPECPAASIPAGFTPPKPTRRSLPVGLQIIGRKYDEETVLAASAAFENAYPWTHHRPPIS